ncbi:MAG TPA: twin-arginine translocase TatA/TatE family subunit [Flavobacteriales bacterium]|nr:twin-arginine translocase TatA/TatE family subunit [Flavobacteriales bacterium]HRE96758.1 twin-arginine translocase TatA/TatE family subunit [Flavobacteriales bacterium]HRJ37077.1 twin-arginine translocase TatA/TatE family subunit [Flavobacteriales bacterium]HRJ37746.1 twin-arginine translocase TatA/TatE family subunit [Flavobacteriales bacterium]
MLLFLNISGGEIVVIFLVVLLLFGPQSIPTIARTLGRGMRAIKDASSELQREIRESADRAQQQADIKGDIDLKQSLDITKELDITTEIEDPKL